MKEASVLSPGSGSSDRLVFNSQCARIRLNGVVIKNKGIDWQNKDNVYWQHKVMPCTILLHWMFNQHCNLGAKQIQQVRGKRQEAVSKLLRHELSSSQWACRHVYLTAALQYLYSYFAQDQNHYVTKQSRLIPILGLRSPLMSTESTSQNYL